MRRNIFSTSQNCYFDEIGLEKIYNEHGYPYYQKVIFANINPMYYNFQLTHMDEYGEKLNAHRIFSWNSGKLYLLAASEGEIIRTEFMYVHFLRRPISISKNFFYGNS